MSLGKGAIYSSSTKQKLNTKSSTEAELVGVDDLMPQILWCRLFLQAQGFNVTDNVIHQDNLNTIQLIKNGRGSSGKRTRHINIRFYFITDRLAKGDISVTHCPTDMLVADFYTKPLQGKLFRIFRNLILNLDDKTSLNMSNAEQLIKNKSSTTCSDKPRCPQECVGGKTCKNKNQQSTLPYTYRDAVVGAALQQNTTRDIIKSQDPSLLLKLRSVATELYRTKEKRYK